MRRLAMIAALVLPVAGLSLTAAWHLWREADAVEWRIPITGYDPRDLLAGHYARFRYNWRVEGSCPAGNCVFCLEDRGGGGIIAHVEPANAQCPARVDPRQSGMNVIWPPAGSRSERASASGRIFIDEREAARITKLLRERNGAILVARLGRDRLIAQRIEPAP